MNFEFAAIDTKDTRCVPVDADIEREDRLQLAALHIVNLAYLVGLIELQGRVARQFRSLFDNLNEETLLGYARRYGVDNLDDLSSAVHGYEDWLYRT